MHTPWRLLRGLKFVLLVTLFIGVFAWIFMILWNALIPEIFGVRAINYWQALGLLLLSRIIFGGGRPFGGGWKHRMHERWHKMTPEERAKFQSGMRNRWCHHSPAAQTESRSTEN